MAHQKVRNDVCPVLATPRPETDTRVRTRFRQQRRASSLYLLSAQRHSEVVMAQNPPGMSFANGVQRFWYAQKSEGSFGESQIGQRRRVESHERE